MSRLRPAQRLRKALSALGAFLPVLIIAGLSACSSTGPATPSRPTAGESESSRINRSDRTAGRSKVDSSVSRHWRGQLERSRRFLEAGNSERASRLLQDIQGDSLPVELVAEWQLQVAEVEVMVGDPATAVRRLRTLPPDTDPVRTGLLMAGAWEQLGKPWEAVQQRVSIDGYLDQPARGDNQRSIWQALQQVPVWDLQRHRNDVRGSLQGWVALALAVRDATRSASVWQDAVNSWQADWEDHPAAQFLPAPVPLAAGNSVAVILPLSGPLAAAGRAVRDGIMAGWMANRANLRRELLPAVRFYDSGSASPPALVAAAVAAGAGSIIGPLERRLVGPVLNATPPDMPVVVLNRTDLPAKTDGRPMIQLVLRPEDESAALAARLQRDGHRRILLLVSDTGWAARISADLASRWQAAGRTIVDQVSVGQIGDIGDLTAVVGQSLNIGASADRSRQLAELLGRQPNFVPTHRQDIDAVVLVTTAVHARVVATALDYHYANAIPIYASSQANAPGRHPELDRIRFCDVPWNVIETPMGDKVRQYRPAARGQQGSLYALGVDAWFFHGRLQNPITDVTLLANTGRYSVNAYGNVERELIWARFKNGDTMPDSTVSAE